MTSSNNDFHSPSVKNLPFIACILLLLISLSVLFHFCYKIGEMTGTTCIKNNLSNNILNKLDCNSLLLCISQLCSFIFYSLHFTLLAVFPDPHLISSAFCKSARNR